MVWSLALCLDDAKQDPVVYDLEFGVVFLAKGPRTTSMYKRASVASAFTIRVLGRVSIAKTLNVYLYYSSILFVTSSTVCTRYEHCNIFKFLLLAADIRYAVVYFEVSSYV